MVGGSAAAGAALRIQGGLLGEKTTFCAKMEEWNISYLEARIQEVLHGEVKVRPDAVEVVSGVGVDLQNQFPHLNIVLFYN